MSPDALLKKYFAVVLAGLVAVMAYFQASGTMRLFGAALTPDEKTLTQAPKPPKTAPTSTLGSHVEKNGDAILARNPFDSVPDAQSALARLTAPDEHFDVLLLDLNLRGTTAADVVRDVDSRGLDVRVILTSGYASEDVPEELMRQPRVAGYLPKPYPVDGLVASVRRALSD